MLADVRYAVRSLWRTPGYALAFVLTLGLGIGLNTAIFSVVNGVLLAPLSVPGRRPDPLRAPAGGRGRRRQHCPSPSSEVQDYREAARTLDEFVEYGDWTFNVVGDDGDPHRAVGGLVTSNYFEVLGLRPGARPDPRAGGRRRGRRAGDGAHARLLDARFRRRPRVLGRTVKLYAFSAPKTTRIVGVLEPGHALHRHAPAGLLRQLRHQRPLPGRRDAGRPDPPHDRRLRAAGARAVGGGRAGRAGGARGRRCASASPTPTPPTAASTSVVALAG